MQCKSLWIKASAKCINVNVNVVGRVETIKMNVLPRLLFLYFFQSLPIFLPKSFFNCLDKTISSFIWEGKIPKVNKVILQHRKCDGSPAKFSILLLVR